MKELMNEMNSSNNRVFSKLRILEFEKNKLKQKVRNKEEVIIKERFDASSVWQSVGLISSLLDDYKLISQDSQEKGVHDADVISFCAFE